MRPTVGVLALQGDFERHGIALDRAGAKSLEIRKPEELKRTDALVIPGGETTTFINLMHRTGLFESIREFASAKPVMGTCAGLIVLARRVLNDSIQTLGLIDIDAERNAYGRQKESFIGTLSIPVFGQNPVFEGVFIRAPKIGRTGPAVGALGFYGQEIVMAGSENILVTTFHPELTPDLRLHRYFLSLLG